jgi:PAS domain S-box-containing protein
MAQSPAPHSPSALTGGGATGDLIRHYDWSTSPLGPVADWPVALRTLVSVMLGSQQPMHLVWGPSYTLLYNDAYAQLLGDKHPQALGGCFMTVCAEVRDVLLPLVEQAYAGQAVYRDNQSLMLQRFGRLEEGHFSFSYTPVPDGHGRIQGFFCACLEITRHVQDERRIIAENARQRRLFERAPGFIAILQGPEHVFEFANVAYSLLFGDRDFLGKSMREAFPELGGQGYLEWLDQVYRTGERLVLSQVPIRLQPEDGGSVKERFLDFIYEPVTNDQGEVTGIFVEGSDVSAAHHAQQALQIATDDLRSLNENLEVRVAERTAERDRVWRNCRDLLLVMDEQGQLLSVNPAWTEVLGYSRSELEDHDFREFIWAEDVDFCSAHFHHALADARQPEGPTRTALETRYRHKDGTARWIAWQVVFEVDRVYAYGRDMTLERAQADALRHAEDHLRQAQKMDTVGQLTGGIAHDFNNLLLGITGSLELIQSKIARGNVARLDRLIDGAMHSARRAAALTHRLLAFARRQPLVPKPTEIDSLLLGMQDLIQRTIGPLYQLRLRSAPDLWPTLCDPHQLESAILNVVINARDAMGGGGVIEILADNQHVGSESLDIGPGDYVTVRVNDTGGGMPLEVRQRAIEPFFTTKPQGQGTGLGLSMVYGFAKQSEGHLEIDSTDGVGTSVAIMLPRYRGVVEPSELPPVLREPGHHGEAAVLLVEDEPAIRQLITGALEELGCQVFTAADGLTGMRLIESSDHFDLLITDLGLPGLNGRELAERAVLLRPAMPIMIITGYAEDAALAKGFLSQGMEMMTKPFALTTFTRNVARLLRQRAGQ